jgi:hypothetical protein
MRCCHSRNYLPSYMLLFPNPVPLNKIPLLYHHNQDEENTLLTTKILRRMLPLRLIHCNQPTKTHWDTSWNVFISDTALQPALFKSVPCPIKTQYQQFSYPSTPDATGRQLPEIRLTTTTSTVLASLLSLSHCQSPHAT